MRPFDAPFGGWRVRADTVDVEFVQGAAELRMTGAARRRDLIYAENARLVAVEASGLP